MISKLRFSLIAVILLVLLGFGFQNEAKGVPGENLQFCPFIENTAGWLDLELVPLTPPDFTGGLIGTVEGSAFGAVGGMDWMQVDLTDPLGFQPFPTTTTGSQIVSWWTQQESRTTVVQLTNELDEGVDVHVRILNSDCVEITDFCDFYTPGDTHAYDLSDLIDNNGIERNDGVLQGREGFLVITAVDDCPSPDQAIEYNFLAATTYVVDAQGYEYGMNAYHRAGVCFDIEEPITLNLIDNGTFETGPGSVPEWTQVQGGSDVVEASNIAPPVNPPLCDDPTDPECSAPNANRFMAFLGSSPSNPSGFYGQGLSTSTVTGALADNNLIEDGTAIETNVTVIQSNIFTPGEEGGSTNGTVEYALALLTGEGEEGCDQYAMVCTINVTGFPGVSPSFEDCDCYNTTGNGVAPGSFTDCTDLEVLSSDTNVQAPNLPSYQFGTRSGFVTNGSLSAPQDGSSYVVQAITAEKTDCEPITVVLGTVGSFVDNFRTIELTDIDFICDGRLTGAENAFLSNVTPTAMAGQFNLLPGNDAAGADVVLINFQDSYGPPYQPLSAFVGVQAGIWDTAEIFNSCGDIGVCYVRLGVDDSIIISDDFTPSGIPTVTPTGPTPTVGPSTPPPTTTPPTNNPDSGGSCAIAGSPVQLGTALANVLIPLVPVAFAFGVRAARRRKNK